MSCNKPSGNQPADWQFEHVRDEKQKHHSKQDKHWKSNLQYMGDENDFVEELLQSEIFEPNRPNLIELLQDNLKGLSNFKARKTKLRQLITKHENLLGTDMESEAGPLPIFI